MTQRFKCGWGYQRRVYVCRRKSERERERDAVLFSQDHVPFFSELYF